MKRRKTLNKYALGNEPVEKPAHTPTNKTVDKALMFSGFVNVMNGGGYNTCFSRNKEENNENN